MGMFDSVFVKCPKCNKLIEFQSKAGKCNLLRYSHKSVPAEIAADLSNHEREYTPHQIQECCGVHYKLTANISRVAMQLVEINDPEDTENEWD